MVLGPVSCSAKLHCTAIFALLNREFSRLWAVGVTHPHTPFRFCPVGTLTAIGTGFMNIKIIEVSSKISKHLLYLLHSFGPLLLKLLLCSQLHAYSDSPAFRHSIVHYTCSLNHMCIIFLASYEDKVIKRATPQILIYFKTTASKYNKT